MSNPEPSVPAQMVFVQKEVAIRKFYGDDSDRAEDFEEEIRRAWASLPVATEGQKLDILLANIGPMVRSELRCQGAAIQKNAELTLGVIMKAFGDTRSTACLMQDFLSTRQDSSCTRVFSHKIKAAFDRLVKKQSAVKEPPTSELLLRDQFVNQLNDRHLSSYLREQTHNDPLLTFHDVRDVALRWAGNEASGPRASAAAVSAPPPPLSSEDASSSSSSRLDRLEKMMEQLMRKVGEGSVERQGDRLWMQGRRQQRRGFDERGRRVCFRCGDHRHILRQCPRGRDAGNDSTPL